MTVEDTLHYRPDEPHPVGGHERSDANIRSIAVFGVAMVVVGVGIHYALGFLLQDYTNRRASMVGSARPLSDTLSKASEPSLQVNPANELKAMRQGEKEALESYGWVDRKKGIVHIPIERAMDRIVEQGLPARVTSGQHRPTGSKESQREQGETPDRTKPELR